MKIAIDISPIEKKGSGHKVRGVGFYTESLKKSLLKYYPGNEYIFFCNSAEIPKNVEIVHYPYFEPFFVSLSMFRNNKIVTVHDLIPLVFPDHFPSGVKGKVKWQIQKFSLQQSKAIITDSYASKNDIIRFTGIKEDKINVVYLAVDGKYGKINDAQKFDEIKQKYNLPEKFVLYVGDVTWNKNLPRLIEAVKKINADMVLVGKALVQNNYDKENLWNKDLIEVKNSIEGNNKFVCLGFIPTEDLAVIYNMAEVFVMPSIYEGFGLPILEAMSCGCPAVTTRRGSLPEVGGDAVLYVKEDDVNDMAENINKILKDEKLQKILSEKGLKQSEKFSFKKMAEGTIKIYEKVAIGK